MMNAPTASLLPLFIWLSPSFPVGAFAYSHGLESAVEAGDIRDAASLESWLGALLASGSIRNDAILLAATMRAAEEGDFTMARDVNALALALSPSRERHLENAAQGNAFLGLVRAVWPHSSFEECGAWDEIAYPVAVGAAAAAHRLAMLPTLQAFALSFVSNLVSAVVRLGPIGQTEAQKVIAALLPDVRRSAEFAAGSSIGDLGTACFRADIASMRHEMQYSRLFRS